MTTTHTPEDPWPTYGLAQKRSAALEGLASSLIAGLGPRGVQALSEAREMLEQRLAQLPHSSFVVSPWTADAGDVLTLRLYQNPPATDVEHPDDCSCGR